MEDKQDKFLEEWASGAGIEFENDAAKTAYQYRTNLIKDAIQLKKTPDRVPVMPLAFWAPIDLYNITPKDAMYDTDVLGQAFVDYSIDYAPDATGIPPMISHGPTFDILKYKMYKWPGGGLRDDLTYQYVEDEYMKVEDYDHLIEDPSDFFWRKYLGRTFGALEPFADMAPLYGSVEITLVNSFLCSVGTPPMQEALEALKQAGKTNFDWICKLLPYMGKIVSSGFPMFAGGATKAPFDYLGDTLRGTTALMMDMYRRPEKVLAACERLTPIMIKNGIAEAKANGNPIIFIPLHKGADGFMSDKQFQKFYWPGLKAVMDGLIEGGCVPCCFVEGGYNERLDYLGDFPKGKVAYYFDKTDMAEARKKLEGKACIGGGFPISQILKGTPDEVERGTKKLLDTAAGDGGYILGIGCAMDEAKEDTLKRFIQVGKEYGKY